MKRFLGVLLSAALVLTCSVPTFAAESGSTQLATVIKEVKSVISVPEDGEFSYSTYENETDSGKERLWDLTWSKDDLYVSATTMDNGRITSYYRHDGAEKTGVASMSRDESEKMAKDFIVKALKGDIKESELVLASRSINEEVTSYSYNVVKKSDGVSVVVSGMKVEAEVDRYAKQVISYWAYDLSKYLKAEFPSASSIIDKEKAASAYIEGGGVRLCYIPVTNYDKKEITVFPAYVKNGSEFVVDANTGEAAYIEESEGGYGGGSFDMTMSSTELSAAEQAEVDKTKDLITADRAVNILRTKLPVLAKAGKVESTYLYRDTITDNLYYWDIYFENGYGDVNAATGEIISFYFYGDRPEKTSGISYERAVEIAADFVKNSAASKMGDVKQVDTKASGEDDSAWRITFQRYANDVEVYGNSLEVLIAKQDGNIYSFSTDWSNVKSFPVVNDKIGQTGAFEKFAASVDFGPMYILQASGQAKLAYGFKDETYFTVNPATGALLNYNGKAYRGGMKGTIQYSDISGKWYEKAVTTLLDNGYYLTDGEKFEGSKTLTQEEFLRYLYSFEQSGYDTDEFYDMLNSYDVVKTSERSPAATITRQDAAKFTIRYLGLEKAAEAKSIYKNVFRDKAGAGYEGYIALAKGLSVMSGDAKGYFNGTKAMTRAEAAVTVLNALNAK